MTRTELLPADLTRLAALFGQAADFDREQDRRIYDWLIEKIAAKKTFIPTPDASPEGQSKGESR